MIKNLLILLSLLFGFIWNFYSQKISSKRNKLDVENSRQNYKTINTLDSLRFEFTTNKINTFKETIEINASIFNEKLDSIFILSSTCDGEQYSLRYDTSKFTLTPFLNCNSSYPKIISIPSKRKHSFQSHFHFKTDNKKMKIGFDVFLVEKGFKIKDKKMSLYEIFNRPKESQTIIWGKESVIK